MKQRPLCPHCRRSLPDLMADITALTVSMCGGPLSRDCLLWTAQLWQEVARTWKDRHDRQADLNCNLVDQNVVLIQRNTRMEAMLTRMGADYPVRETFEPPAVKPPKPVDEPDPRRE